MFMRRRPLLRAAVVGGGAYVAGKKAAQRSAAQAQQDDEQNERIASVEQQQASVKPGGTQAQASAGGAPSPSMLDQLNQLTSLHKQGALTDSEFSAAKAKLIGG
jgi:hypothetical protein